MPYVLLTADPHYGESPRVAFGNRDQRRRRAGRERGILVDNVQWARQVDVADIGGVYEHVLIPVPHPGGVRNTAAVLALTIQYWGLAATRAGQGGIIGVLLGHGSSGVTHSGQRTNPFVDLAPGRYLRVTYELLQRFAQEMRIPSQLRRNMTDELVALREIETVIKTGRLARVDLLTCDLGGNMEGEPLLRLLRRRWETPLRGLRGYLTSYRDPDGVAMQVEHGAGPVGLRSQVLTRQHREARFLNRIPPARPYWYHVE